MSGYFYILASKRNGTIYCGVTNDLVRRVSEHKNGKIRGFTAKYGVKILVYYEFAEDITDVLHREKCVKEWKRAWKLEMIESFNPSWKDLYDDITQL